mmetsp:Transcript_6218/g.9808  ORF Transcript_6218/g.9808 Transcript_6218/m.9808 type:complete len:604 (+) Transcript_6218:50-1861(+)
MRFGLWGLASACWWWGILGDESNHVYKKGDEIVVWLNKIGPYHNPQETYTYYTLPFCLPEGSAEPEQKYAGIGEILEGNELVHSSMTIPFAVDIPKRSICKQVLTDKEANIFKHAISQHYWYQLSLDDLPVWGMVGEIVGSKQELENLEKDTLHEHKVMDSFIHTHKAFSIGYNKQQIIEVNLTYGDAVDVEAGAKLEFSYSVKWVDVDKTFADRFNRYLDYSFFEHQIHWFSIFNSFMMVIFLCGLVALILMRTLKNDYAKYHDDNDAEADGIDRDFGDDSGWKQIHGDVFRIPSYFSLYAACYGTGMQMIFLAFGVILLAIFGSLYIDRGALISASLACYALTSVVSGYVSGSLYQQYYHPKKGPHWIRCMLITALLLPSVCFMFALILNMISYYYRTIHVVPLSTLFWITLIWLVVALPLTVLGTVIGRNRNAGAKFPCRVNALPRQIPEHRWYTHPLTVIALTGWLPFGSIFIEMYFIFTSFWNYKFYYVYGFMLLVYIILSIVTICVTIVAVYFLLNAEDYRWPWISFMASSSTSVYVFLYSVYYFMFKTNMTGFLQTSYYFSYMMIFCLALGLMCGTIGATASMMFVKRIYQNLHVD